MKTAQVTIPMLISKLNISEMEAKKLIEPVMNLQKALRTTANRAIELVTNVISSYVNEN